MRRISASKKTRFDIFKRDGFQCQYCGATPPAAILEIDHIHPVSKGGGSQIDNLITSCFDCNRGKAAGLLSVAPQTIADKTIILEEKKEQLKAYERLLKSKSRALNKSIRGIERTFQMYFSDRVFSETFKISVKRFFEWLTFSEIEDAMHIACSRISYSDAAIKYFCGVCWKRIRDKNA